MKATITLEQRYERTPDGSTWTPAQFPYNFWTQYLDVFDEVQVLARVRSVSTVPEQYQRVDGDGVRIIALPHYLGPRDYLKKRGQIIRTVKKAITLDQTYVLRVSSQIGALVQPILKKNKHPYGLQVVCDPHDVFAPGVVKHPLSPAFRFLFTRRLKKQCLEATGAAYVTQEHLQKRYPCPAYMTAISDVQLNDQAYIDSPRSLNPDQSNFSLVFVGSLAQLYKAPDLVVSASAECIKRGLDLKLTMIGDGQYRPQMEALVEKNSLTDRVIFTGQLSGAEAVRDYLDRADLFLLPSRTEGLPRAVVEAMARGLPAIGSTAGGIPELLPAEDLVPPGDSGALADKIEEVLKDPTRREQMSKRNLEKSKQYHLNILREKQRNFFLYLKKITAEKIGSNQ